MNTSPTIAELTKALSKAQGQFDHAKKDVKNEFFKSKYADLASVIDAAKKPLADNGLAVIQTTEFSDDGKVHLLTLLSHVSGEWIQGRYPINPTKQDPQGFGSAMTYARRYAFSAITGIAAEDDDGNADSSKNENATAKPKKDKVLSQWIEKAIGDMNKAASLDDLAKIYRLAMKHGIESGYDENDLGLLTVQKDNKKAFLEKQPTVDEDLDKQFTDKMERE